MKNNSTVFNNNFTKKSIQINNSSSLLTAENSSSFNKSKRRPPYASMITDKKYLNTAIFEKRFFKPENLSKAHLNTESNTVTDIFLTTNNTQKYLTTSYTSRLPEKTKNNSLNFLRCTNNKCFTKKDESLPQILTIKINPENFDFCKCCDIELESKYLQKLYLTQLKQEKKKSLSQSKLNQKRQKLVVRDSRYEYIQKTNDINRLNYYANIKNDKIQKFKNNIKAKIKSLDHTKNKIDNYKYQLENKIPMKLNEQIHKLYQRLFKERLEEYKQKQTLNNIKKDIESIQLLIQKKEIIKKTINKWIILQVTIKNGHKVPKEDEKKILDENRDKLVFENIEDMMFLFHHKENKNIRLMKKLEQQNREKQELLNELAIHKKYGENTAKKNYESISEKEKSLFLIKDQYKELANSLKDIIFQKEKTVFGNVNNHKKNTRKSIIMSSNRENKFKNGNIYELINTIYTNIISYENYSKIQNLDFLVNIESEMKNANLSCDKKALIQMKLIEIIINYLKRYIRRKGEEDINNIYIMKKTKQEIELEHKKMKAEKHKIYLKKRMGQLVKRMEEKNNKIYFLSGKKVNKYNMVIIEKKKLAEKLKKKKKKKVLGIEDFLYDEVDMKSNSVESMHSDFDLDSDEKED